MTTPALMAGAAKSDIDIPASRYPVDGFGAEHDRLHARTVLLDNGVRRIALAVVDLTSIPGEFIGQLTEIVAQAGEVSPENIIICASHTFSAPHIGPLPPDFVGDAVARCAADARRAMRPARVGFGLGTCGVNVNRDVRTTDGWWHGCNESGVSDRSVAVIRIDDLTGHPIAIVMNYAVQSSIMNESVTANGHKLVTADLAGAASRYVERQYGDDTVALFLIGAAGDQAPYLTANRYTLDKEGKHSRVDVHDAGFLLVELLGERLGSETVRVSEGISAFDPNPVLRIVSDSVTVAAQAAPDSIRDIRPAKSYDFRMTGKADAPIWVARIGDIALAGLQAELSSKTGIHIKKLSAFQNTIVMTMVNGGAKYMPDAESYDKITYEAMNSRYARGSAEIVASRIAELLNGLR